MIPSTPGSHGFNTMSESCHLNFSFSWQVVFSEENFRNISYVSTCHVK
jgi:hypothetical protein